MAGEITTSRVSIKREREREREREKEKERDERKRKKVWGRRESVAYISFAVSFGVYVYIYACLSHCE